MTPTQPLVNAERIAELYAVHVETVRESARQGRIPARRIGRNLRFDLDDVAAYFEAHPDDPLAPRLAR